MYFAVSQRTAAQEAASLGEAFGFSVVEGEPVRRILHCFMRKIWCLEMVNFIEVLEDIGCFGFLDVGKFVHVNLERIWH